MNKPVVLITGASSGIGAACARALQDYRLILVARREERLQALCAEVGENARYLCADLSDAEQQAAVIKQAGDIFGSIDVIINNAGIFAVSMHADVETSYLQRLWQINVQAPMVLTRDAMPFLRQSDCGHIINISSVAAEDSFTGCAAYSASKAALEAWSRGLREELRAEQIRVSVIAPGATATEIWGEDSPFDMQKMSQPDDVAAAVVLCLQAPAQTTFERIRVSPSTGAL